MSMFAECAVRQHLANAAVEAGQNVNKSLWNVFKGTKRFASRLRGGAKKTIKRSPSFVGNAVWNTGSKTVNRLGTIIERVGNAANHVGNGIKSTGRTIQDYKLIRQPSQSKSHQKSHSK